MALRGNLKDFSLPDVFQLVTFSRKTGVLRIEREDSAQGSVWFRDGDVFFAQSNWHTELLGERLVRAQRLTSQALARALKIRTDEGEDGRRLGQILIDEGYITDEVLEAFVSEQIQETIFDLMRWDEGEFDFEAMPEAVEEDIGLSVSIENVIMEGSRRLEEWTRIKKKIPSVDVVFKMATAPGEGTFEISLKPMEWNLLLLVDGTRSVAELAYETDRTDFEVARIVYGLFSAGLLEFATDEEVEKLRAERAERDAQRALIDAERRAVQAAAAAEADAREAALGAEARAREAALDAEAKARRLADVAVVAEPEPALVEPAVPTPHEVPEFLGGMSAAPSVDDAAVLEEMMGAVLQRPAREDAPARLETVAQETAVPEVIPTSPHVPAEDPAFMAVEHQDVTELPLMPVPSVDDLLNDLADLQAPDDAAASDAAASAVAAAWEEAPLVEAEPEAVPELAAESEPEPYLAPEPQPDPEPAFELQPESDSAPEPISQDSVFADLEQSLLALGGSDSTLIETAPAPAPEAEIEPAPEPDTVPRPFTDFTFEPSPVSPYPPAEVTQVEPPEVPVFTFEREFEAVTEPASMLPPDVTPLETAADQPVAAEIEETAPAVDEAAPAAEEAAPAVEDAVELVVSANNPIPDVDLPPTQDATVEPAEEFERDLMALGLGELPADLFGEDFAQDAAAEVEVVAPEPEFEWVETPAAPVVVVETAQAQADAPDFSELLESLDVDSVAPYVEPPVEILTPLIEMAPEADFDEELLREVAPVETGGVISTDAFLDDITIDDMDFSGGLTDELSALTGADRPSRPTTNVNRITDANSGELLHRDARVDRDTLLRIIDGVKNL